MPRASFGGSLVHEGIPAMAGAYLYHLCKNHPFVDGNKRVALAVALYFLVRNGMPLDVDNDVLQEKVLAVASGQMEKDEITAYLVEMLEG